MCTIVFPSAWKSGIARRTSASSPPIMITRRASIAPTSPPETGASSMRKGGRFACARRAMSLVAAGLIVLMSTRRRPSCAPDATPSGSNTTASTSGVFVTIVTTMSLRSATSRGVFTTLAPASPSGLARSSVRFVTDTGNPALSAFRAIGAPMIPMPTKPMRSTRLVLSVERIVAREEDAAIAALLADEERALLGLVDVHRRDEQIVRHVDESGAARELVRDRLGQRSLLERVDEQRARPLHEREELTRLEASLVREQHRGAELLVPLVDLVEEHQR